MPTICECCGQEVSKEIAEQLRLEDEAKANKRSEAGKRSMAKRQARGDHVGRRPLVDASTLVEEIKKLAAEGKLVGEISKALHCRAAEVHKILNPRSPTTIVSHSDRVNEARLRTKVAKKFVLMFADQGLTRDQIADRLKCYPWVVENCIKGTGEYKRVNGELVYVPKYPKLEAAVRVEENRPWVK